MAIDLTTEEVHTLTEWTRLDFLPVRRNGKRVTLSTLYRWTSEGCRGIKLEFIMIGCTRATSREALQRFFDDLTFAEHAKVSVGGTTA